MNSSAARLCLGILALVVLFVPAGQAQPFGTWMTTSTTAGYLEIPHNAALNPIDQITIEAWVSVTDGGGCSSIVGKNFTQAWWVGLCGTTLRSYVKGSGSLKDGGTLDAGWNHIAVTYDGARRRHYINGEMVLDVADTGAMTLSTSAMRIASDVSWDHRPTGAIDEIRIWNVARTQAQIQSTINVPIAAVTPGLVSVWSLDGSGADSVDGNTGTAVGSVAFLTFPVAASCSANATTFCFEGRFAATATWLKSDGTTGVGTTVSGASSNSGLFWFFDPTNWELLVKELNGCSIDSKRWVFSAATTNVHYRLTVTDVVRGAQRIYFNYQGQAAPAVTDTQAVATCP
jgi:hypothetical protein